MAGIKDKLARDMKEALRIDTNVEFVGKGPIPDGVKAFWIKGNIEGDREGKINEGIRDRMQSPEGWKYRDIAKRGS